MATYEERIQAKMAMIRAAEEKKKEQELEAKLNAEALERVEAEKLEAAFMEDDIRTITKLSRESPSWLVKTKAGKYMSARAEKAKAKMAHEAELRRIAKEAFDRARKEAELAAAERKKEIRELVKMTFWSYMSNNVQSPTCSPSMFKNYQKQLIEMGVTEVQLRDPTINRVRVPSYLTNAGSRTTELIVDISYILTASAPLRDNNKHYALYGTISPHGSGADKPRWID